MTISYWLDNGPANKIESDIVIIGAGIAGLSAAYWLCKEDPEMRVTLVDKGLVASGATGRNAGFITCGSVEHFNRMVGKHGEKEATDIWNYSEKNLDLLLEHIIQDKQTLGYERKGSFSLASSPEELKELFSSAELMEKMGIQVENLNQTQVQQRLGAENFVGGVKYILDASIHPVHLTQEILAQTQKLSKNFQLIENSEVFAIESSQDGHVVKTNQNYISCSSIVFATNGYSKLLSPYFDDKIFPTRGQILCMEPVDHFMEGPCYANFVLDYFRQMPTGELIIGGFRQLQKDVEIGYSDEISDVIQNALLDFIHTHLPKLKDKKVSHRWTGVMGFSADGQPLIGAMKDDPSLFYLGGFTAHGLGLAFHGGKSLVDLMFGREIPSFVSGNRL